MFKKTLSIPNFVFLPLQNFPPIFISPGSANSAILANNQLLQRINNSTLTILKDTIPLISTLHTIL